MAWDKGFSFRSTSGYVTDPTDTTYALPGDAYPTTRNSVTFGWLTAPSSLDRSTGVDARLAGINASASDKDFQIDLPASGDYTVYLAMGDASSGQTNMRVVVLDNTTTKLTIGLHNTNLNSYYDASDVQRTEAQWVADSARGGTGAVLTFSSTTLVMRLDTDAVNNTAVAHFFVSQVAAATAKGHFYQYYRGILNV